MKRGLNWIVVCLVFAGARGLGQQPPSFINFETAPIHPVALSPDGQTLVICNLPDGRLNLFNVSSGVPEFMREIPVGVDPVSARFRSTNELWVVNHISSSVSIVDVARRHVVATLQTRSGPADIVFAGSPGCAFISCAKENVVQVFDPVSRQCVTNLSVDGDRPRAMAVSPDGARVYVAIFESGNGSTVVIGEALRHPAGPYGGQVPVPNDGLNLRPPLYINPDIDPEFYESGMPMSLIVKKNSGGRWMDDNQGDWTEFISGTNSSVAGLFGRPPGWDMPDHDLAILDTSTLTVSYATGLMNICMDVAANPASGRIAVIGTDGTNERRFEPNLRGTFVRVNLALVDPVTLAKSIVDLNPHLDYSTSSVPQSVRDRSIGDPRGIVWNANGTRGYVTGMGSRNLIVIDANGNRVAAQPVELDEGPTGLALDEARQRLYVWNRFSDSLSAIDTTTLTVVTNVALFDPTPPAIKVGRKHLYDTRKNSGLGQAACASCHVDGRVDRLAWDLGNPSIDISRALNGTFHPMKGPLVTQTFQDIIGSEPLHWRGDRGGIETFNVTFTDLLGADTLLTTNEMQEFKDFLATIHFPPNRFRNFDNTLPTDVPLPGQADLENVPLPNGNAVRGHASFVVSCIGCHQIQTGRGTGGDDVLVQRDGRPLKVAQLRSLPDKLGMDLIGTSSRAGFGFRFDGRDDSLARFLADIDLFAPKDRQELADMIAFLLSFSGSQLERPIDNHLGLPSKDVPAATGRQVTLSSPGSNVLATAMLALANFLSNRIDLVARGVKDGLPRNWLYNRASALFQSDRNDETLSPSALLALAAPGEELTFTIVPAGTGRRLAIDRDEDGYFDRTELELGLDPKDPLSRGSNTPPGLRFVPPIFVHRGMPISVALEANDADATQSLSFSLLSELPAGASFDPAGGLFTWIPTSQQSDRQYHIGVQVTDNGTPPLSDTLSFEITVVSLRIVRLEPAAPMSPYWLVTFDTVPGVVYQLQYKTRLDEPWWNNLTIYESHAHQGIILDDSTPTGEPRFYRMCCQ